MKVHDLKCWPEYFRAIVDGAKTFEYRLNDRNYQVGDILALREWDNNTKGYTIPDRIIHRKVTYLLKTDTEELRRASLRPERSTDEFAPYSYERICYVILSIRELTDTEWNQLVSS